MLWLTSDSTLVCSHELGRIQNEPSQNLVTIGGVPVLVEPDPEGRRIKGCPNIGITIKPCWHTLAVKKGLSEFIRVGGKRVCLDSVSGITDGTPPGVVVYKVNDAGQDIVSEAK
jgi:hypothetical protein